MDAVCEIVGIFFADSIILTIFADEKPIKLFIWKRLQPKPSLHFPNGSGAR